jgi:hypothetical protein
MSPVFQAWTISPTTGTAPMATLRVDIGTWARHGVIGAQNRWRAAAAIAAHISPATLGAWSVSQAGRWADDVPSCHRHAPGHLHWEARPIGSSGSRAAARGVSKEPQGVVCGGQLRRRRRRSGSPSTCQGPPRATRTAVARLRDTPRPPAEACPLWPGGAPTRRGARPGAGSLQREPHGRPAVQTPSAWQVQAVRPVHWPWRVARPWS